MRSFFLSLFFFLGEYRAMRSRGSERKMEIGLRLKIWKYRAVWVCSVGVYKLVVQEKEIRVRLQRELGDEATKLAMKKEGIV